jgi:hypothetical protein
MFATFILILFYRYDRLTASLWIRYPRILLGEGLQLASVRLQIILWLWNTYSSASCWPPFVSLCPSLCVLWVALTRLAGFALGPRALAGRRQSWDPFLIRLSSHVVEGTMREESGRRVSIYNALCCVLHGSIASLPQLGHRLRAWRKSERKEAKIKQKRLGIQLA